jgi:hypothetical protein
VVIDFGEAIADELTIKAAGTTQWRNLRWRRFDPDRTFAEAGT